MSTSSDNPLILLAPMDGLTDVYMRQALTAFGGYDYATTEFVRITSTLLPSKVFYRYCPELKTAGKTAAGTPVYVQLLGSEVQVLAENAARAAELGAPGIDLNFGCPAKTVNRHRGGAVLLTEPELLHDIASAVRKAVPKHIPVTAKMRLGFEDRELMVDNARALASAGMERLIVHARTKTDGYKPPAYWERLPQIVEAIDVPVVANGEVWTVGDYQRCVEVSGCRDVMVGRGGISTPDLAYRIRNPLSEAIEWPQVEQALLGFCKAIDGSGKPDQLSGKVKQWLGMLQRSYPQAAECFAQGKRWRDLSGFKTMFSPHAQQAA